MKYASIKTLMPAQARDVRQQAHRLLKSRDNMRHARDRDGVCFLEGLKALRDHPTDVPAFARDEPYTMIYLPAETATILGQALAHTRQHNALMNNCPAYVFRAVVLFLGCQRILNTKE